DFAVYGMAVASNDDTNARKFYEMLREKYGLEAGWNAMTVMGLNQTLIAVRSLEAAVKKVGADKVTGANLREAMVTNTITSEQTFGILPNVSLNTTAPFPLEGLTVNIATVKDGKHTIAAEDVPVPTLNKW